ncbi:MAG TPA: TIM barrel protein, partial [Lacipirellulaceae bacterium]|nr:TIM barrel protein [Lacipirellulaceae bacterium]
RFSFGPWNISEGADPFGPEVRSPHGLMEKLDWYRPLGFEGVQFHDDDAVENIDDLRPMQIAEQARTVGRALHDRGLTAEFVAPRLWFHPQTIDGGYTSNSAADRQYALDRSIRTIDVARELGTTNIVLWLAREGTYVRESKSAAAAYARILDAVNALLEYDKEVRVWIEPKPNEPMDQAYVPMIGHAIALAYQTIDPSRVSGLIESAHALLAGLDPSDEMAFALSHGKLASVHLNDQNGLKYDQDKAFGSVNLRGAYNQVRVLEEGGYGRRGEFVGLDVKAMRTQPQDKALAHLAKSRATFLALVEKVRSVDRELEQQMTADRDYEALEAYTLQHLMGVGPDAWAAAPAALATAAS